MHKIFSITTFRC